MKQFSEYKPILEKIMQEYPDKLADFVNRAKPKKVKPYHREPWETAREYTHEEYMFIEMCRIHLMRKKWSVGKVNEEIDEALNNGVMPSDLIEHFL